MPGDWTVEFYRDEKGREPVREWADKTLSPQKRAAFRAALRYVLIPRGTEIVGSEYGKALGGGLYELRLRWTADEIRSNVAGLPPEEVGRRPERILLRVFFCTSGQKLILLLSGYDKGKDPSARRQQKEITRARKLLTAHREAQRRSPAG
jgi:hypothetical protein